ncbi:uncharacterized protein METZ01_LOCUS69602 [marine metagenome]|uniref:Uncharacterized protein n=1 Tax=marine metagenome TaxID=408172 RepID=A0A381TMI6_9ZZZZ
MPKEQEKLTLESKLFLATGQRSQELSVPTEQIYPPTAWLTLIFQTGQRMN